jgi:hypothetical protein
MSPRLSVANTARRLTDPPEIHVCTQVRLLLNGQDLNVSPASRSDEITQGNTAVEDNSRTVMPTRSRVETITAQI